MFKGRIIFLTLFWIGLVLICGWLFLLVTPANRQAYAQLMDQSDVQEEIAMAHTSRQQRFNVVKHILLTDGGHRLHWRLSSAESELIFDQQGNQTELIEQFKNVRCVMQEEVIYRDASGQEAKLQPNGKLLVKGGDPADPLAWILFNPTFEVRQYFRTLNAEEAVYHYKSRDLVANQVRLARYVMPGDQFTESFEGVTPILSGIATEMELSLSDKSKPFKARGFQASFQNIGKGL